MLQEGRKERVKGVRERHKEGWEKERTYYNFQKSFFKAKGHVPFFIHLAAGTQMWWLEFWLPSDVEDHPSKNYTSFRNSKEPSSLEACMTKPPLIPFLNFLV